MNPFRRHSPPFNNGDNGLTLPPEEYRQLTSARSPSHMRAYLAAAGGTPCTGGGRSPACHLLDMKYAPNEQCTLLYQWGDQLWIGLLPWQKAPLADHAHYLAPLNLWLYPFPYDPALPTLATVLDDGALTELLRAALPLYQTDGMDLVRAHATPLRYRPGKRCTVQIDLLLRSRQRGALCRQRLYGKLYHDADKAAAVYEEMHLLANAVNTGSGALTLATAVAFVPALSLVLQAPVAGQPLDLLLRPTTGGTAGTTAVMRAAQALAALHQLPVATERRRPGSSDVAKLSRRVAKVATVAPALGEAMVTLARHLADLAHHLPTWGATTSIGHGDCKPSQFLLSPDQVALLDFDHCGMADPAADVALFLATLRQARVHQQSNARRPVTAQPVDETQRAAFYTAYATATGAFPDFACRVAWYEALALLRKAWRSFARSPWSPLPALLVDEARRSIDKLS